MSRLIVNKRIKYGKLACSPNFISEVSHLGRIQRLPLRLVTDFRHLLHEERLQWLGLHSLHPWRQVDLKKMGLYPRANQVVRCLCSPYSKIEGDNSTTSSTRLKCLNDATQHACITCHQDKNTRFLHKIYPCNAPTSTICHHRKQKA